MTSTAPLPPRAEVLTPPPHPSLQAELRGAVVRSGRRLVVLDDDPTGTQSVADVPVVTAWGVEDLAWALRQPTTAVFVLTNTRAMPEAEATAINREIAANLATAAELVGVPVSLLSRGDSTLRGHFPAETDALAAAWQAATGTAVDAVLVCPAFLDAGRLTYGDVHYVVESSVADGDRHVPVAQTPYARDATFGYQHSDLREWVAERSGGRWAPDDVVSIGLADIRAGGPARVTELLLGLTGGRPAVVNATEPSDLEVVALAALAAEAAGRTLLYRTGPSFVRYRAGLSPRAPLTGPEVMAARTGAPGHGLVVVGSHVPLSTRQAAAAEALGGLTVVELDPAALLTDAGARPEQDRALDAVRDGLRTGDVMLRTARTVLTGADRADSLRIAGRVARALVSIVEQVVATVPLRYLVAKGGITSSDVLTTGLRLRRGWVLGQMLPGVIPVWTAVDAPGDRLVRRPPCVIFPGNVGDDDSLAHVISVLRNTT